MINFIKKMVYGVVLSALCTIASFGAISTAYALPAKEVECLSSAAYHEARNQGDKGMLAVMHTILNRTKDSRFPSTPCKVIAQPKQFSYYGKVSTIKEVKMYERALELASDVVSGRSKDFTKGSLFFVNTKINPIWLKDLRHTCTIGNHKFFK